ncbi:MAG: zinc-ribbon domain-containing protein [Asgard group archaeon]|nr:zinc-ribbon domain-containing protein [Asgard group archaeon]
MSRYCSNCGSSLKDGEVYCPFCGIDTTKISQEKTSEPLSGVTITCSSCDSINEGNIEFCKNCGSPLTASHSSSYESSSTYTYGSAEPQPTGKRPWYKPPKRERSAKHPREWAFWTGWGFYVLFRFIFQILFYVIIAIIKSRRR